MKVQLIESQDFYDTQFYHHTCRLDSDENERSEYCRSECTHPHASAPNTRLCFRYDDEEEERERPEYVPSYYTTLNLNETKDAVSRREREREREKDRERENY